MPAIFCGCPKVRWRKESFRRDRRVLSLIGGVNSDSEQDKSALAGWLAFDLNGTGRFLDQRN